MSVPLLSVDWNHIPSKNEILSLINLNLFHVNVIEIVPSQSLEGSSNNLLSENEYQEIKDNILKLDFVQYNKVNVVKFASDFNNKLQFKINKYMEMEQQATYKIWSELITELSNVEWAKLWENIHCSLRFEINWVLCNVKKEYY